MSRNLQSTTKKSSSSKTYFIPNGSSVPNDLRAMVELMPMMTRMNGKHGGIDGQWAALPETETLEPLEKYRIDNNARLKDNPRTDEPPRLTEDQSIKPKPRKVATSPQKDTLEDSEHQLDRDLSAIRQKERELEKAKGQLEKAKRGLEKAEQELKNANHAHEEKARELKKNNIRATTKPPDEKAKSSRNTDESREKDGKAVKSSQKLK